ncbi:MAG: hypothetical protein NTZ53_14400 [Cyanobacteria bacterium]|nr:hypothetical protein [Cyanobacteriota bacterium]
MSTNLQDAYIAVEHAYSMQQFPEALRLAKELLPRIPTGAEDQLDLRLQLLVGHTYLYGLGQPQKALPCYQEVLKQSYDPTYRELAEQGVNLCQQAGVSLSTPDSQAANADQPVATSDGADASAGSGAAVPWLDDLSGLAGTSGLADLGGDVLVAQPWATAGDEPVKAELVERIERIEPEVVEGIEEPVTTVEASGLGSPQAFSPAEAAELAKGLLRVVLR